MNALKNGKKEAPNSEIQLYQQFKGRVNYLLAMKALEFEPHEGQLELLDLIQKGEFNIFSITNGRRYGKSLFVSRLVICELLIPYSQVLLVTPTFSNAKAIFDMVLLKVQNLGLKIISQSSQNLSFTVEGGQRFVSATSKSIVNVLGQRFSLVICDETQDIGGIVDIIENKIQPAQADYGVTDDGYFYSKTLLIGTARDEDNDWYEFYERGELGINGYKSINHPTHKNPYISKEFLRQKELELPPRVFSQEYLGIWSKNATNIVYFNFDIQKHTIAFEDIKYSSDGIFYIGLDFGFNDSTCATLCYFDKFYGIYYVLGEYIGNRLPLSSHAKGFIELENKFGVGSNLSRFSDPSAIQAMTDLSYEYNYESSPAFNKIFEGTDTINDLFSQDKLIISKDCVETIAQVKSMAWKNKKTGEVERNKRFSHFDIAIGSLRYCVATAYRTNMTQIIMFST